MKRIVFLLVLFVSLVLSESCKNSQQLTTPTEQVTLDTVEVHSDEAEKVYRAAERRINDLLHTKLDVSFDWDSTYLYGKANLTFTPYFYPTDSLIIDAKGFQIHELALVNSIGVKSPLKYSYDSLLLKIKLDTTYSRKDTFEVFIKYTAMPNKLEKGGSAAITSDKGLYFINPDGSELNKPRQIWTQGETESSSCWFPTIDAPNEKTTQEIYITIDSVFKTLSNGSLIFQTENADGTRTDFWKQDLPHTPYLFMMAIGEFAVVKDRWRNKPVHYYVEPEYEAYAKDIYPNTPEMMEFFSNKLNYDYPWDKYHQVVVRDYVSGAMENTGAVIYGDFVQGNDRFLIDHSGEDVVAHELFHHWFGDLVTCESWANLPLNESFATYGEYLWNEYKYGIDQADYHIFNDMRIYLQSARMGKKKLIRFDYRHRMEMFDAHSYQKGGRILHMLRKYVGDEAFFTALNHYLKSNAYSTVEIHQLRLAFEEITGEDLNWFFNQWFLSAGHPKLKLEKKYVDSTETLKVSITQTQKGEEVPDVFKLPTDLEVIKHNGEKEVWPITITQDEQTFEFAMDQAPLVVNLDANKILLAEIDQKFSLAEAALLFQHGGNFLDRYNAIKEMKHKKDSLAINTIKLALNDPFWKIRELAIEGIEELAEVEKDATFQKLTAMATKDEKSNVRAKAIVALSKYYKEEVSLDLLSNATEDRSYRVVSIALNTIYEKDEKRGIKAAKALEKEDDTSVKLAIADIYAEDGSAEHLNFYKDAIAKTDGFDIYPLSMSYGDYLDKQDAATVSKALPELKSIATDQAAWWMRMGAVNSIIQLKNKYADQAEVLGRKVSEEEDLTKVGQLKREQEETKQLLGELRAALKAVRKKESNDNVLRLIDENLD